MIVQYSRAMPGDIPLLVEDMREADRKECLAHGFLSVTDAVEESLRSSSEAWCGWAAGGELLAMFGVTPITLVAGCPWLLTTNAIEKYPVTFMREAVVVLASMRSRHPFMAQLVHKDYSRALRFVERLGFEKKTEVKSETGASFVAYAMAGGE